MYKPLHFISIFRFNRNNIPSVSHSNDVFLKIFEPYTTDITLKSVLYLVVGYSEKGPFNTPVYIDNTADFKTIFGGISKKLEKKGISMPKGILTMEEFVQALEKSVR